MAAVGPWGRASECEEEWRERGGREEQRSGKLASSFEVKYDYGILRNRRTVTLAIADNLEGLLNINCSVDRNISTTLSVYYMRLYHQSTLNTINCCISGTEYTYILIYMDVCTSLRWYDRYCIKYKNRYHFFYAGYLARTGNSIWYRSTLYVRSSITKEHLPLATHRSLTKFPFN